MKHLTISEANLYLSSIGMKIGDWNQIVDCLQNEPYWVNYQRPTEVNELYRFAQHVSGWLPDGKWKIVQIDNSTSLTRDEALLFYRLLIGSENISNLGENRTFIVDFCENEQKDKNRKLLTADLVFVLLLFNAHGYIASSGSSKGELLSIQDGYTYFSSRDEADICQAEALLREYEKSPLTAPKWVSVILADDQG